MNSAVIVWLVVFAISALIFFGVAVAVSVKGFSDLLSLLRHTSVRDEDGSVSEDSENV